MYSFRNDYSEGAHPQVLQALADTNAAQTVGYGMDPYCQAAAADTIRRLCAAPDAAVHFLVGGTQANLVTIDALLQSYEAVIAAQHRPHQRPRDRRHRGHRPQGLHRGALPTAS